MSADAFPSPPPVSTVAEAEAVMRRLMDAMETLETMIKEETALVREGRLREASRLEQSKSEFARSYVADMMRFSASSPAIKQVPLDLLETFRQRHARFHDALRLNMTVLATAHAVSEDLIRGVSGELARKTAPQTYGASGRPTSPGPSAIQPLAVSRSL